MGLRFGETSRLRALLAPLRDAVGLFLAIRGGQPDVVHVNPSLNLVSVLRDGLFMLVLRALGKRSVLVIWHGWENELSQQIRSYRLLRYLFMATFGWAGHSVVLASRFRDELIEMGFAADRVSVESTMFDNTLFNRITRRQHECTTLLFLSRMEQTKGGFELVEAYSRIKARFPATRLVMAGDGPARKFLESRVAELGVADVSFPGYLRGDYKAQALVDADLFVLPTTYGEGCPVSLLEAMAAGLPCITNAVGGIPDIFRHDVNGVLLNGVSVDSVTGALVSLLGDPSKCARIAEHNRQEAWKTFSAPAVTRRIETLYNEVSKLDVAH